MKRYAYYYQLKPANDGRYLTLSNLNSSKIQQGYQRKFNYTLKDIESNKDQINENKILLDEPLLKDF